MKNIKQYVAGTVLIFTAAFGLMALQAAPASAGPADEVRKGIDAADANSAAKDCGPAGSKRKCGLGDSIQNVINTLLFVVGVVAVIMIVLGGLRYVLSNGDSAQISSAKNTVLYSVIGLVVALLAYAIVNFVVTQFA